ncbi:MAG: hypothetical protein KBD76_04890 [Bacteriovorax sp.]|jgi:hypothetical protein|nr:hypothetical protein [Bacteriovorax sp.]
MKILLAFLVSLTSFNILANDEILAVDKFTTYLPIGAYVGTNDEGEACEVSVSEINFPQRDILVKISALDKTLTKLIEEKSIFKFRDYKREFIQTDTKKFGADSVNYVERIVRTVRAENDKQYIAVSYSIVTNTTSETDVLDCIVDRK